MMRCTTHPTALFLCVAVISTAEGQEGQLLWELQTVQSCQARTAQLRNYPHGWEKVTLVTILATEGPSKEARLGFPIWQRKGGEENVGQAKKSKLPLEVWWGVSHDFHWQLYGFVSCSGFYHRALPPLHSDEGLFCKEKRDHGGELKETGCHNVLLLSTGPTARTKDRWSVMIVPLSPSWEPWGMQEGWAALRVSAAKKQPPKQVVPCAAGVPQASRATGALHLPHFRDVCVLPFHRIWANLVLASLCLLGPC